MLIVVDQNLYMSLRKIIYNNVTQADCNQSMGVPFKQELEPDLIQR